MHFRSATSTEHLKQLTQKQRDFDTRFCYPKQQPFNYDPLKDSHNSYYFESPSVQRHLKRLKNIIDKTVNPETIRLSKSIAKIVHGEKNDSKELGFRGDSQRRIYVVDYRKDVGKLEGKLDKRWVREKRRSEQVSRALPNITNKSAEKRKSEIEIIVQSPKWEDPQNIVKQEKEIQHNKFVKFLRNKKMEVFNRKIYFRSFRSKTQNS